MAAFIGKTHQEVHKITPGMDQAIGENHLKILRDVAVKPVAHLQRRGKLCGSLREHIVEILAGMPAAGKKEGNFAHARADDDAGGEHPGALGNAALVFLAMTTSFTVNSIGYFITYNTGICSKYVDFFNSLLNTPQGFLL